MTDNVVSFPGPKVADMFGPEETGHSLIIEQRLIPNFRIRKTETGVVFTLDGRFAYEFDDANAWLAASMAAQAMAIGAGYARLGSSDKSQPFAPEVFGIDTGLPA
jgi:hypothetical protein